MSNPEIDDLEDGEIEEDEEEVQAPVPEAPKKPAAPPKSEQKPKSSSTSSRNDSNKSKKSSDKSDSSSRRRHSPPPKKKRPAVVEDDFSAELEKALAMALKKDGVEPPMPNLSSQKKGRKSEDEDNEDRSRSRKRRKGNSNSDKNKKKSRNDDDKSRQDPDDFDEYEMLCVRGGSPPPNNPAPMPQGRGQNDYYDSDHSSASSNYEANENKKRYEDKRQRHREKMQRDRKMRNDNNKRGGRNRGDSEGDDCMRSHEARAPRKMELCKFYLMECCAKRENCLYMHSDFPCKYYYLGMKCPFDKCVFMHGKPLTDQLRMILLKHLETAPKEILGDFPRLNHDTAVKMLTNTHKRLTEEYEARHRPQSSGIGEQQGAKEDGNTEDGIPSLFDFGAMKPPLQPANNNGNRSLEKPRKSRWCDPPGQQVVSIPPPSLLSRPPPPITQQMTMPPPDVVSLKSLGAVLAEDQLEVLAKVGISTLEQLNQLTVGQLGDLGISISQLSEIQMTAKNIKMGVATDKGSEQSSEGGLQLGLKDMDMRVTHSSNAPAPSDPIGFGGGQDVDMRFLNMAPPEQPVEKAEPLKIAEIASPDHQPMSFYQPPVESQTKTPKSAAPATSPSPKTTDVVVDYSQYLRDSNLLDKDDDHEENNREESDSPLQIDESYCPSDEEKAEDGGNAESDTNEVAAQPAVEDAPMPLQPAVFDPTALTRSSIMANLSKIDLSASVSQLLNTINMNRTAMPTTQDPPASEVSYAPITSTTVRASTPPAETTVPTTPPTIAPPAVSPAQTDKDTRDPRMRRDPRSSHLAAVNSASDGETTPQSGGSTTVKSRGPNERLTIYDQPSDDEANDENADDYDNIYGKKSTSSDRDMRFPYGSSEFSANSDIDLRLSLPFKPVHHHVPATEIDGSISSYMPKPYKVAIVDVPRPRYRELRKNKPQHTLDPRLRRIFGISDDDSDDLNSVDPLLQRLREKQQQQQQISEPTPTIASPTSTPPTPAAYVAPRVDPRRKKETQASEPAATSSHTLDIQSVIHKNNWYKDLSSKQKIMVNQQLALLSMEMKKFHQDTNPDKVFDLSCVVTNSVLQDVLLNLGIYIDDSGNFIEVNDDDMSNGPKNPNIGQPPPLLGMPPTLDFLRLPPPHTLPPPPINRPGMLGMDNNFRFTGPPPIVFPPGRPGLLGVAPPNVQPFNTFIDPTTAVSQMIMQNNNPNNNMNNNNGGNYRNSGGRSGHQNNNERWGRNNDRNNRRDRDHRRDRDNKKN